MTAVVARGHRTLPQNLVQIDQWLVSTGGGQPEESPEALQDWTPEASIEVTIQFHLDWSQAHQHLKLDPSAHLVAMVSWRSPASFRGGVAASKRIIADVTQISAAIPGQHLGDDVRVTLDIVVLEPGLTPPTRWTPVAPGSIVWRERRRVVIEGSSSRLPIEAHDFAAAGLDLGEDAIWHLRIEHDDLEAPVSSALRLWLNTGNKAAAALLDRDAPGREILQRVVMTDVARQLTLFAIGHESLQLGREYPEASLGATLVPLVTALGRPLPALRELAVHNATELDTRIQSHVWRIAEP